jgi:hypothetical protein
MFQVVNSLNKLPLALLGLWMFNTPWNLPNLASIAVGLLAGVFFVLAKSRNNS